MGLLLLWKGTFIVAIIHFELGNVSDELYKGDKILHT